MKAIYFTLALLLSFNFCNAKIFYGDNDSIKKSINKPSFTALTITRIGHTGNKKEKVKMTKDENEDWNIDYTAYQNDQEMINLETLQNDSLWFEVLKTKIHFLPDWEDIQYKFSTFLEADLGNGTELLEDHFLVLGESYEIEIWTDKDQKYNKISYASPEACYKKFPEVDETKAVAKLIGIFKEQYQIFE